MSKENTPAEEQTFEAKVNSAVAQMTQAEDGTWALPDTVTDEAVRYAANLEKRRRDTQSAYSKTQAEKARLEAENKALGGHIDSTITLTAEQQSELDELKHSDPDEWLAKKTQYEGEQREAQRQKREELAAQATQETELQRRERLLNEYNEANPDKQITDDTIENDLPPRLVKQLANGMAFEDFLEQSKEYLYKDRVIAQPDKPLEEPDLSKVAGGHKPSDEAVKKQSESSYASETF